MKARRNLAALALAGTVLCAGVAPTPAAQARTFDGNASARNLGGYNPERSPSIARAISRFGAPDVRSGSGSACTVRWNRLGLTVLFANFGGGSACGTLGRAQRAHVAGAAGRTTWSTGRGLRVGDSLARLRRLYPRASRHGSLYWLTTEFSLVVGARSAVLSAYVRSGRVRTLWLWIGAAGD